MISPAKKIRTRLALPVLAVAMSLALAGCGGGKPANEEKPKSQPVQGGTELAALWPLTGEKVEGATPEHPVMVVKIDNTSASRPQVGLRQADMITEELVEGGMTRLAVMFYSKVPDNVGPVRSMRATDIGVVKPAHGVLVASGGAPPTLSRMRSSNVTFFEEGGPGYYRNSARRAPYNLFVHLDQLAKKLKKQAVVPASYLPWGTAADFAGGQPATRIQAKFSGSHTTTWQFQGGKYVNANSNAAEGDRFNPDTVLVLRVKQGDAGYRDPAGNPVPESIYKGTGNAMVFHNGQMVRATWKKGSLQTPLSLSTAAGPLKVPAGKVWIELVPTQNDGGDVTFGQ